MLLRIYLRVVEINLEIKTETQANSIITIVTKKNILMNNKPNSTSPKSIGDFGNIYSDNCC